MKILLLLRHAKSDWSGSFRSDHERPLNSRGEAAAPRMGAFVADRGFVPDVIKCSTAVRTRQTCALFLKALDTNVEVEFLDTLYGASEQALLSEAMKTGNDNDSQLILAHNPGIHGLALDLIAEVADGVSTRALHENFATAALAVFTFDVDRWQDIAPHTGTLICFQVPKDL